MTASLPTNKPQLSFTDQLRGFQQRLLQIDARNPSVFCGKIHKSKNFDLCTLDPAIAQTAYLQATSGKGSQRLISESKIDPETQVQRAHLKKVAKAAAAREEETGLRELRLGTFWLQGYLDKTTYVRAPLCLSGVDLVRAKGSKPGWTLKISQDDELIFNNSLLATLRRAIRWSPGDELWSQLQQSFHELTQLESTSIDTMLSHVAEHLRNAELPLLEVDSTNRALAPQTKKDALDSANSSEPGLSLVGYALIGIFPQSSTALYQDFEELITRAEGGEIDQGIVDNLLETPGDDPSTLENSGGMRSVEVDDIPAGEVNMALPCDPSQFAVLREAQTAECTVVRGPPGTGKSQVIANLIVDALSRNERVLVCCQKRAALDVVRSRLESTGLSQWSFVVHDASADRSTLYTQLNQALERSKRPPGPSLESRIQTLSLEIDGHVSGIRNIIEPLRTIHHGRPLGRWYRKAPLGVRMPSALPDALVQLDWDEAERTLERLANCRDDALRYLNGDSILHLRRDLSQVGQVQLRGLLACLDALSSNAPTPTTALVLHRNDLSDIQQTLARFRQLAQRWYKLFIPDWWRSKGRLHRFQENKNLQGIEPIERCISLSKQLRENLDLLSVHFDLPADEQIESWITQPELRTKLEHTRELLHKDFDKILAFEKRHAQLDAALHPLLIQSEHELHASLGSEPGDTAHWRDALEKNLLLHWIDEAERHYPSLRGEPFSEYAQHRAALTRALDVRAELVAQSVVQRVHHSTTLRSLSPEKQGTRTKPETEWNKLAHQLGKKRALWPIRKMLETFSWPLRALAPCWLLSPEVAAEVLPLERGLFDLVIFDEASQLRLERALPVVYRAKRVVVAGDEQQMPPSNFFEHAQEDDEDAQEQDDARTAESLLEQSKKIYGFRYLQWHYRSQHGELIDFSNQAFYDGALHITPGPTRSEAARPFVWHELQGLWEKQTNAVEAQQCAKLIVQLGIAHQNRPRSIGVITVNAKQKEAIDDAIDRLERQDPQAALVIQALKHPSSGQVDDRLFVKNIENVQGDERDIIVFCSSYARPAQDQTMRRNFGAIGRSGGENRLNVAFTRSREQMHVMCSFDPDEVPVQTSKNRGPKIFMAYLKYARAVARGQDSEAQNVLNDLAQATYRSESAHRTKSLEFDSDFEEQVYDALVRRGLKVDTQVGAGGYRIDLAVVDPRDPTKYCLAIECDGASYHSGASVRERDVARQALLEARGWVFERIWSRDWWRNSPGVIDKVVARVEEIVGSKLQEAG